MGAVIQLPGGKIELPKATKAELVESALAWLTLAQSQVGEIEALVEKGSDAVHIYQAIAALRSKHAGVRRALSEAAQP